jgi:hypothetical protein
MPDRPVNLATPRQSVLCRPFRHVKAKVTPAVVDGHLSGKHPIAVFPVEGEATRIGATTDRTCAAHYLTRQLDMLPNATAVAFGGKAKHYMRGLNIDRLEAYALAPPGANHKPAKPSWERAIAEIEARRAGT